MPSANPIQSTVQHRLLEGQKVPEAISTLETTCDAGSQCPEVQNSGVATAALNDLKSKVSTANSSLVAKQKADQVAKTAAKTLRNDVKAARVSLDTYETSVVGVAGGDAAIINKSGCLSRPVAPSPPSALEAVTLLSSAPGKVAKSATLSWPAAPGAASYAVEVNHTPQTPAGPWIPLGNCTRRTKAVTTPTAGAQFLAHVASVSSDGTQADWSDAVLGTSR